MKNLILALFIVLTPTLAHAMVPVISEPVTHRAESAQGFWSECGVGTDYCPNFPNGLTANQSEDGLANEFVLEKTYILKEVSGWYIPATSYQYSQYDPSFEIRIYQGTRLRGSSQDNNTPDLLLGSWTVQTPYTYGQSLPPTTFSEDDLYRVDNLNIVLPAGKYWIAAQAGGDGLMYPGNAYGNSVVPEPTTMLLFGAGLVGAFLRKRRA